MGKITRDFLPGSDPIKHVVLLIMENHSFDQMLGCMNKVHPTLEGVDPSHPRSNSDGKNTYFQVETRERQMRFDPKHEHVNVAKQLANDNSGFVFDFATTYPSGTPKDRQEIMGYYPLGFLPALHTLATEFTVCDHWFSSLPGPTWPNRFFALSGTSSGQVLMPDGFWHPDVAGFFDQTQTTIFDRLNQAGRSWKVYHYDMACSWILVHQREIKNLLKYHGMDKFFDDARAGDLPDFTFIEPKYSGQDENDDHPPHNVMKAEKLIADVYNAIRGNPSLWESTLFVVFYDEHGGFYDHVTPPPAVPPDDRTDQYTFDQYGVRVPAILVSPWLPARVDKTQFDHTSLLRYLVEKWRLDGLGRRTTSANSIAAALQFESEMRQDTTAFIRVSNSSLYAANPEFEQLDNSGHQRSLRVFAEHLQRELNPEGAGRARHRTSLGHAISGFSDSVRAAVAGALLRQGASLARSIRKKDDVITEAVKSLMKLRDASPAAASPPNGTTKSD